MTQRPQMPLSLNKSASWNTTTIDDGSRTSTHATPNFGPATHAWVFPFNITQRGRTGSAPTCVTLSGSDGTMRPATNPPSLHTYRCSAPSYAASVTPPPPRRTSPSLDSWPSDTAYARGNPLPVLLSMTRIAPRAYGRHPSNRLPISL